MDNRPYIFEAPYALSVSTLLTILLCIFLASSCKSSASPKSSAQADSATVNELPLPDVPASLTDPSDRAAYLSLHFWDAMDFCNGLMVRDTAMIEQTFANFLSVLEMTDLDVCREAVESLVARSSANGPAFRLIRSTADHYLADPNSPLRNEDLLILFLEEYLGSPLVEETDSIRYAYLLERASMNRPGTKAPDFNFKYRRLSEILNNISDSSETGGTPASLYGLISGNELNVLVFYDPDCEVCKKTLGDLAKVEGNGDSRVIPVNITDLPDIDDLYDLPASPTIYLLDPDANILAKDFPAGSIAKILSRQ